MPKEYIILIVATLIALPLLFILSIPFLRGTLTIAYNGEFAIWFRLFGIKIKFFPQKERKKHYKKTMSRREAAKIREAVRKKEERRRGFIGKLFAKKKDGDTEKKAEKEKKPDKVKKQISLPNIPVGMVARELIDVTAVFTEIIAIIVKRFAHHLKIKIARLRIRIATEDPAVTAVTYGAVSQIINLLIPILSEVDNLGLPKKKDFDISCDFGSSKADIDLKVSFSLRVWHISDILIRTLFGGLSKYVSRKGGIDKTFEHIGNIINIVSPQKPDAQETDIPTQNEARPEDTEKAPNNKE